MTVRIVTDSNAMIPWPLVRALGLTVVPLTVTVGGDEYVEDAALDLVAVYRRLRAGEPAATSAPAPGAFAAAYSELAPAPIVSIHVGAAYSGTLNAARLGAAIAGVNVRLVDTNAASFMAGCCVLAAAETASAGGDDDEVAAVAEATATQVASVFTITELDRAIAGGRLPIDHDRLGAGTPLVYMRGTEIATIGTVESADEAADGMYHHITAIDRPLRLGVGDADAGLVVDQLATGLRAARPEDEVIRYAVGPTLAAHTGMGTFGVVYTPRTSATGKTRLG
jgi:fatty acid kinase fatty acid binding subunit